MSTFIKFGDLVSADGYGDRIFEVICYRKEETHYRDEYQNEFVQTDIIFEISDVHTLDYLEADENDLTLICREDQAEQYLANAPLPQSQAQVYFIGIDLAQEITINTEPVERKLTPREQSSREAEERKQLRKLMSEVIDDLLIQRKDYEELYRVFGDEEYNDRIFAIDAEINKLQEEGIA